MNNKIKIGVVVGRFQPLHAGHLNLIKTALSQNDLVKIAIGSAQYTDPLTVNERRKRLERALTNVQVSSSEYEIYELPDIHDLPRWPTYLKKVCALNDKAELRYYTSDPPAPEFKRLLEQAGFIFCLHPRPPFNFRGPDDNDYTFRSATEIRDLYKRLGMMDKI